MVRLMRLGMSRRPSALGLAGGMFPADDVGATRSPAAVTAESRNSLPVKAVGGIVAALFEWPLLKNAPPIPLGVVWIVANFYLLPMARRIGGYCVRRWAPGAATGS
jgi:hypothetical protein